MLNFDSLLSVALAFLIVTVSPGPANIAAATIAMKYGRRSSLLFGAGLSTGLAVWGVIAATGMGAILQGSVYLLMGLKIFGGLYLLWLAYQSGRAALAKDKAQSVTTSEGRWFVRGLLLNLSNPKAVIAWMAALSMGMGEGASTGLVVAATLVCISIGFLNYIFYGFAFSLGGFARAYRGFRKWIDGVVAGLFALAGLGLIRSAFTR